jgi:hypothetical protein
MSLAASVDSTTAPNAHDGPMNTSLAGAACRGMFGDFRDDLARDGFAVVKGAVPLEKAQAVTDKIYQYLEDLYITKIRLYFLFHQAINFLCSSLGFDRHDPSTIKRSKLPYINEKGMLMHYGSAHEDFVWDIRSAPGVIEAFEKVFNTPDLIVSFDAINVSFHDRADWPPNVPWAHQDQDPDKPGFRCLQGLVNLQPCGPNDGGLIACRGGHLLSEQFHEAMKDEERIPQWTNEWYGFTDAGMSWLADHGCTWEKVCADPGDLIVWDSRTPHYNKSPENGSKQDRMAIYVCYMPVANASQEDLIRKKGAWDRRVGTSHWPNAQFVGSNTAMRNEDLNGVERLWPVSKVVLSERAFKLTGIPYIKSQS